MPKFERITLSKEATEIVSLEQLDGFIYKGGALLMRKLMKNIGMQLYEDRELTTDLVYDILLEAEHTEISNNGDTFRDIFDDDRIGIYFLTESLKTAAAEVQASEILSNTFDHINTVVAATSGSFSISEARRRIRHSFGSETALQELYGLDDVENPLANTLMRLLADEMDALQDSMLVRYPSLFSHPAVQRALQERVNGFDKLDVPTDSQLSLPEPLISQAIYEVQSSENLSAVLLLVTGSENLEAVGLTIQDVAKGSRTEHEQSIAEEVDSLGG